MDEKFKKWLIEEEGKKNTTAYSYSKAIDRLSQHYSSHTGKYLNIYTLNDLGLLKSIRNSYDSLGKYSSQGDHWVQKH